jgi:hypothetical protein
VHPNERVEEPFALVNWEPSARITLSYVLVQELNRLRVVPLCEARSTWTKTVSKLRQLNCAIGPARFACWAGRLPYDFGRRAQLHALADGFARRAEQLERTWKAR